MKFQYLGKQKLLRLLKMQLNNPYLGFSDIMYDREENFAKDRIERVVYINDEIHYTLTNEYSYFAQKTKLFYRVSKLDRTSGYIELENIVLKESEDI